MSDETEWVLVPREPTPGMLEDGGIEFAMTAQRLQTAERCAGDIYRAMLAAAPQPPAEAQRCTCPSGDGSLRWPCPAHPAEAQAQGDGEVWQQPDALPPVEPGKQGWFWVAVRRASNGRVYSFPATYLNAMKLMDENGDQEEFAGNRYHHGAVDEDEGTFLATGWHDVKEHSEFSGVYLPLLDSDKDELIAWRAVADYGDTAPPSAPVGVEAISEDDIAKIAWQAGFHLEKEDAEGEPTDDWQWPNSEGENMFPDLVKFARKIVALAQQPAAPTWIGIDWAEGQQPAAVDGARWMVFNVGCIECGVSSNIVGVYATQEEAERVAEICGEELSWRNGGQNSFEVFDLLSPQADEYRQALAAQQGGRSDD